MITYAELRRAVSPKQGFGTINKNLAKSLYIVPIIRYKRKIRNPI